jgi:argininosuccinate lyase
VSGALLALLTTLKGLPAGYSRDLQEDKEIVFEALDLVRASVRAMQTFLAGVTFSAARMSEAAHRGLLTATEIADYLARKGMPFRDAHEVAGRVVQEALERGCPLWELPLDVYTKITPLAGPDILDAVRPLAAVEAKRVPGGTAKAAVQAQLADARRQVAARRAWAEEAARQMQRVAALGDRG